MSFGLEFDPTGWKILGVLFAAVIVFAALSLFLPMYISTMIVNFLLLYLTVLFLLMYLEKAPELKPKRFEKAPSLTVLVPCFNSRNTIEACITAIKQMTYPKKFRILVVDDGSTDGSKQLLRKIKGIELIEFEKNKGKGFALNRGLEEIETELVVCIDSDTYPEKEALNKAVGFFADEKVGAVNGLLIPDKRETFIQRLQYLEYLVSFGLWNSIVSLGNGMTYVTGPFTVFRRSALKKAGYFFDTKNLAEDMEIGLRLQKFGYRLVVCPLIVNETDVPSSFGKLAKQRDRWYRSRVYNLIKYRELFFRKQHGSLGLFFLPYLFLVELVTLMLFLRIIVLTLNNVLNWLQLGNLIFFSARMLPDLSPDLVLPTELYFFAVSFSLMVVFYVLALHTTHYKFNPRDLPVMAVHLLLYPLLIAAFYLGGIWHEWKGARPIWERVST